ncbi:histidine N-alpha-methyltransferase-like [Pecten maximus]|uniref:histidine N-alpha-methyltransferase-like n=1 Tax=Pecten maximus TaxID=6579 RepID=UPI001458AB22|nr:histidine N-alpha-methyltransferase-like [Pecten maximus]
MSVAGGVISGVGSVGVIGAKLAEGVLTKHQLQALIIIQELLGILSKEADKSNRVFLDIAEQITNFIESDRAEIDENTIGIAAGMSPALGRFLGSFHIVPVIIAMITARVSSIIIGTVAGGLSLVADAGIIAYAAYNLNKGNKTSTSKMIRKNADLLRATKDIVPNVSYDLTLVDLGSGNCSKTRFVIDELLKRKKKLTFYPVDISAEFLMNSSKLLSEEYDNCLEVRPIAADYVQGIEQLKRVTGAKLILWLSSIFNLPYDGQVSTLSKISTMMSDKCVLVFTADITQDEEAILKAYDNNTERTFCQYAITRMNREEGSDIDLARFTYHVDFVRNMSYVRSYMEAKEDTRYTIRKLSFICPY